MLSHFYERKGKQEAKAPPPKLTPLSLPLSPWAPMSGPMSPLSPLTNDTVIVQDARDPLRPESKEIYISCCDAMGLGCMVVSKDSLLFSLLMMAR